MAKLTEIIVAVEAEGVNEVLTALGNIEGAQTQLANKTKQSADDQKGATGALKSHGLKWRLVLIRLWVLPGLQ